MRVFHAMREYRPPPAGTVVTVGNFDGVHRGHMRLFERCREIGQPMGASVLAITFHPHPIAVLAPEREPPLLTTPAERVALLERAGVDDVIVLHSNAALLAQSAESFLADLVAGCRPRTIVEGPDFRFGHGRAGTIETLRQNATRYDYEVGVVPAVHCDELPARPTISSSSIRQALVDGRIDDAAVMLGRPYRIVGATDTGRGRGAGLGFPTANLAGIPHLLPQQAVYAAVAQLDDESLHLAAVNMGPQPTFGDQTVRVEAHVLDYSEDLRGRRLGLHFLRRLREQMSFPSRMALIEQIRSDVATTRSLRPALETLRRSKPIPL